MEKKLRFFGGFFDTGQVMNLIKREFFNFFWVAYFRFKIQYYYHDLGLLLRYKKYAFS